MKSKDTFKCMIKLESTKQYTEEPKDDRKGKRRKRMRK